MLNIRSQKINDKWCVGQAQGGITISEMLVKLKNNNQPLADKLIIHLGANDFLRHKSVADMQKDYDDQAQFLSEKDKQLVLLTIPPIPKLVNSRDYHDRI